jgi:hypothetical protein
MLCSQFSPPVLLIFTPMKCRREASTGLIYVFPFEFAKIAHEAAVACDLLF